MRHYRAAGRIVRFVGLRRGLWDAFGISNRRYFGNADARGDCI